MIPCTSDKLPLSDVTVSLLWELKKPPFPRPDTENLRMGGTTLCNQACFLASEGFIHSPNCPPPHFLSGPFSSYLSFSRSFSTDRKLYINHKVRTDRISLSYPYFFLIFFSHQFFSLSHSKGVAGFTHKTQSTKLHH